MKALFLLFVAVTGLTTVPAARAGWENGNAGDAYVSEFVLSGRDLAQRFDLLPGEQLGALDLAKFRRIIVATEVVSEENVFLDGHERDAVNYYPNRPLIKVSRSRWREMRRPTETKARLRLVLHEYLWMTGVEDERFQHSERLIELLNVKNYSPSVWWNPVNPVNTLMLALRYSPGHCVFQPVKLDPRKQTETLVAEPSGDCEGAYRRVEIVKVAGQTPPSSNVRGLFHTFTITVFDREKSLGEISFEPEWGACLLPEEGVCRSSGKMAVGGVDMNFWFLRD